MHHRRFWRHLHAAGLLAALLAACIPAPTHAATDFAANVFRFQWDSVETATPNFWGPLANATAGIGEPYAESPGGGRLVQYFDKARMEQAGPNTVTNGLLTVELRSGRVQTGNDRFEQRAPANIVVAGDPGQAGPTYANLALLPERVAQTTGAVLTTTYSDGAFVQSPVVPTDPQLALTQYLTDPGGRFGQYIPRAFADYLNALPLPATAVLGYPITPAFGTRLFVGGVPRPVFIQAFERRVLTYTPGNPRGFEVEFGNIGRHYYGWRYTNPPAPLPPGPLPPPPAPLPPFSPFPVLPPAPLPTPLPTPLPAPMPRPSVPLPPAPVPVPVAGGVDGAFAPAVGALTGRGSAALPLGNATGTAFAVPISYQPFEGGFMLYLNTTDRVYVLNRAGQQLASYADTFNENGQEGVAPGPRPNTFLPVRGFGKVYRENPGVQTALGLALAPERGYQARVQTFERGLLLDDVSGTSVFAFNTATNVWDIASR